MAVFLKGLGIGIFYILETSQRKRYCETLIIVFHFSNQVLFCPIKKNQDFSCALFSKLA